MGQGMRSVAALVTPVDPWFWTDSALTHLTCGAAGDMAAISQLHAFLEHWGLINFQAEQDSAGGAAFLYSGCSDLGSVACLSCTGGELGSD